jgi:hypothetical protein
MKTILVLLSILMLVFLAGTAMLSGENRGTIQGVFSVDKACYGSVAGVLLHDFVNDCETARQFEGLEVIVIGKYFDLNCAPDEQCPAGLNMKDVSVTIVGPGLCCEECIDEYQQSPAAIGPGGVMCASQVTTPSCKAYFTNNMEVLNCLSQITPIK